MVSYKCKTCGGQLEISSTGGFVCPFCGSKSFMSDEDYKGNETFRKKLLDYYKAESENKELNYHDDFIWHFEGRDSFSMLSGQLLNIEYMNKYRATGFTCYIAKESVVYIFDNVNDAKQFMSGLKRLDFPAADDKLYRAFPELIMEVELSNGGYVLAFRRRPNFFPAEMFAPWASEHLAWVISRMENICCALTFSGIEHGNITPTTVWVNPVTHEGILFGDWRKVRNLCSKNDLIALRKTAIMIASNTRTPRQLYTFLNTPPARDAFADFTEWDQVIKEGFGGHKFVKMKL